MHTDSQQSPNAFSVWLRTGRLPRRPEIKFNPWHDTRDGRFTFAGAGRYYAAGSAGSPRARQQSAPPILFKPDAAKPLLNTEEEVNAWAAALLAEHGKKRGVPEAIEAQRQLYLQDLAARPPASPPGDIFRQVADFAGGFGEGVYDVSKGAATGLYALATTNPITSIENIGSGIARSIDGAIEAENTPAYVHLKRAKHAVANASARDFGYAFGTFGGNAALAIAPGAIVSKVSGASRAGRAGVIAAVKEPPPVVWVDETLGVKGVAKDYNDAAMRAHSDVVTRRAQVPALERTMPDGTKRPVKFDGLDGEYMIDRKWSVVTAPKAKEQALRQSEALSQHNMIAFWEVPNMTEKNIALKMLSKLKITNIFVRVVEP